MTAQKIQLQNQEQAQKSKKSTLEENYPHLIKGDDPYSGKLAAKNIRIELKKLFPKTKFSVRMSSFGCLYIYWLDGAKTDLIQKLVNKYNYGYLDEMQLDMVCTKILPFHRNFGGSKYIFFSRERSDSLLMRSINIIWRVRRKSLRDVTKPTVEDYKKGLLRSELRHMLTYGLEAEIHQISYKLNGKDK